METIQNIIAVIFDPTPPHSVYTKVFFVLSAILLIGAIALKIIIKKKKKEDKVFKNQFKKYPGRLITTAILLFIYAFSRYYMVAFISMRVLLYLVVLYIIWVIYSLVKTFINDYPQEKKRHQQ